MCGLRHCRLGFPYFTTSAALSWSVVMRKLPKLYLRCQPFAVKHCRMSVHGISLPQALKFGVFVLVSLLSTGSLKRYIIILWRGSIAWLKAEPQNLDIWVKEYPFGCWKGARLTTRGASRMNMPLGALATSLVVYILILASEVPCKLSCVGSAMESTGLPSRHITKQQQCKRRLRKDFPFTLYRPKIMF